MSYTNARIKVYPQKATIQVASRDIFPVGEPEPRPYSVPSAGKAKNPERALAESRRRAAAKVRDIALCNNFEFMFTWTLNPKLIDRYDADIVHKKVRAFLSNAVQRKGFEYVAVPELHDLDKCGGRAIHLHGLCKLGAVKIERAVSPKGKPLTDKAGRPIYNILDWKWGFSTCVPLDFGYEKAVNYITKYITKDEQKVFGKWYLSSRGLKKRPDIFPLEPIPYLEFRNETKLKVHLQTETEIYPTVHLISEELPKTEDIITNE